VEILNTNGSAFVVNNGSRVHLSFEENPAQTGDFWGLRWAGTDHGAALQAYTNAVPRRLTWDDSALAALYRGKVAIYTNATDTLVGFVVTGLVEKCGTLITVR
jgi:hypothetical protein